MRSNSKQVRKKMRQHIMDCMYDSNGADFKTFEDAARWLISEFKRVANNEYDVNRLPNHQDRFEDYLMGIPFHFEYENSGLESFLNGLGINPKGKKYSSDQMWRTYTYLIWKEISDYYYEETFTYEIFEDGTERMVFKGQNNDFKAWEYILKEQPFSVAYAINYNNWRINVINEQTQEKTNYNFSI